VNEATLGPSAAKRELRLRVPSVISITRFTIGISLPENLVAVQAEPGRAVEFHDGQDC